MEYLQHLDRELFIYLNNLGMPAWDWFWLFITNKWASLPLYALLIYLLFKKTGYKAAIVSLVLVAVMITCTDQLANVAKDGFARLRPCNMDYDARFLIDCWGGGYGFFSAHAESSMALAIFVGLILKRYYRYALLGMIIWSLFTGYSRIYVGKHYPGDVLAGWLVGFLIGLLFFVLYRFVAKKYIHSSTKTAHQS